MVAGGTNGGRGGASGPTTGSIAPGGRPLERTGAEASRELGPEAATRTAEQVPQKNSEPNTMARSRPAERPLFFAGEAQLGAGGGPYP